MKSSIMYKDIPIGRCFRMMEAEKICSRSVSDDSVFVKMGNSHAICVQNGKQNKTIIPGLKVKCTILPGKIDTSHLYDEKLLETAL